MADLVVLDKSVGKNGANQLADVIKIGGALTLIGPSRGGVFAPPLTLDALAAAIEQFQRFQTLPVADGRIDPGGGTLKRINAIVKPGVPAAPVATGGQVRRLATPLGLPNTVSRDTWSPDEVSLTRDMVFNWTGASGSGSIQYFELTEDVVPNWFGVVVPVGLGAPTDVHIFFHPTPGQAGYDDAQYKSKTGWTGVFHYMSDPMAAQFCAASTGQVLIMPLMTSGAAQSCGVFPERWESIVSQILGLIAAGDAAQTAAPRPPSTVVVSSFSSGIIYSAKFRARAALGARLRGIIDFDGIISTNRQFSQALPASAPFPIVRMQQTGATAATIPALARQNIFPLPAARWGGPFAGRFSKAPQQAVLQIHGTIPQTMMRVAAGRTRP